MQRYKDINHDSNVEAYSIGPDYIEVKFKGTARTYRYSYRSAGREHVEQMKILAERGDGLSSYIMRHVKYSYE